MGKSRNGKGGKSCRGGSSKIAATGREADVDHPSVKEEWFEQCWAEGGLLIILLRYAKTEAGAGLGGKTPRKEGIADRGAEKATPSDGGGSRQTLLPVDDFKEENHKERLYIQDWGSEHQLKGRGGVKR